MEMFIGYQPAVKKQKTSAVLCDLKEMSRETTESSLSNDLPMFLHDLTVPQGEKLRSILHAVSNGESVDMEYTFGIRIGPKEGHKNIMIESYLAGKSASSPAPASSDPEEWDLAFDMIMDDDQTTIDPLCFMNLWDQYRLKDLLKEMDVTKIERYKTTKQLFSFRTVPPVRREIQRWHSRVDLFKMLIFKLARYYKEHPMEERKGDAEILEILTICLPFDRDYCLFESRPIASENVIGCPWLTTGHVAQLQTHAVLKQLFDYQTFLPSIDARYSLLHDDLLTPFEEKHFRPVFPKHFYDHFADNAEVLEAMKNFCENPSRFDYYD